MSGGAAEYDRRIGFERFSENGRNALNEPTGGWVLLGQALARRRDVGDSEKVVAGREVSALTARFMVRSTALSRSVTPEDRLVMGGSWDGFGVLQAGEVWDIDGVKEVAGDTHGDVEITAVLNRENQVQG